MEIVEKRVIAAGPDAVWTALLDPAVLRRCIPGCQEIAGTPEAGFDATVVQKVGPVKATFRGRVTLEDVRPGAGCRIVGEGKGGAAGFAKGAADVALSPVPEGTELSYKVDAKVGGKLAQLGARVIDGVAKRMADQFFDAFQREVEAAPAAGPETTNAATTGPATTSAAITAAAPPGGADDAGGPAGWLGRFRRS